MKKKQKDSFFPTPSEIRGIAWMPAPPETKLLCGLGALVLGAVAIRYSPKIAQKVIPFLVSAFTPPEGYQVVPFVPYHPEAMEPIETRIDERQLGRSEVIREIARPRGN